MVAELVKTFRTVDMTLVEKVRDQIAAAPRVEGPVECRFTPGLMTRKIFMAAGTRHLSKIHRTHHQFFVIQGACLVSENGGEPMMIVAPYHGETKPGTWRELFIIMDCVWITAHPTDKTTVQEVEQDIIQPMEDQP